MRAAAVTAAAALALAPAAALGLECPRGAAVSADALLARTPESPHLAAGGRAMLTLRCVALASELVWHAGGTDQQPAFSRVALVGAGAAADWDPRTTVHALLVAGGYYVQVRDYVYGGWRDAGRSPWALGASAGVRWRARENPAANRAFPVIGAAATLLRVSPESDRLRGVSWGGWVPMIALSLGIEWGPARR